MTPRRLIEPARLAGAALLHTQSDQRLVDLARSGNDRAFEAIVARYRRPLLRYCRRLMPAERAEDAVQQAFLNAYRAIGAGEAELNLRPWLYRIAHNSALSLLRQNGWNHEQVDERFDGVQQPPQAVEQSERVREVVRAVQALPERQRDAMVLRELEGRSYEEIAAALGVTDGAVRQLLNRARNTLRAAATALTPMPLAELCAGGGAVGAGGFAVAAKLGTVLVVAGAVAGGTGAGPLPGVIGGGSETGTEEAEAAESRQGDAGADGSGTGPDDDDPEARERTARARSGGEDDDDKRKRRRSGDGDEDRDERSGSHDDEDEESGEDSEDDDSDDDSRSGEDTEDAEDRSSPDGVDSADDDSSGSGSSGSGSSGSGSGSSEFSGSNESDSSDSGSGSDDSESSATDPESSGSGSSGPG